MVPIIAEQSIEFTLLYILGCFKALIIKTIITVKAVKERRGIVIKPRYSTNFVVHDTPVEQGAKVSGIIL